MKGWPPPPREARRCSPETFHSIADTGNQVLLFVGMRLSERPPTAGTASAMARTCISGRSWCPCSSSASGAPFSIWEGVHKLLGGGEHGGSVWWSYAVLAAGFVFESLSLAVALRALLRPRAGSPCAATGATIGIRPSPPWCSRIRRPWYRWVPPPRDLAEPGHRERRVGRGGLGLDRVAPRWRRGGARSRELLAAHRRSCSRHRGSEDSTVGAGG